jgi:hypothetical protein
MTRKNFSLPECRKFKAVIEIFRGLNEKTKNYVIRLFYYQARDCYLN